jgi:transposase-like protein
MNDQSTLPEFQKNFRTTNLKSQVHKELKHRNRKIGNFPNDSSLLRLPGSIHIDLNQEWIMGNWYLSVMSEMITL